MRNEISARHLITSPSRPIAFILLFTVIAAIAFAGSGRVAYAQEQEAPSEGAVALSEGSSLIDTQAANELRPATNSTTDVSSQAADSYSGAKVTNRTAGTVSYDAKKKTLTLRNVRADSMTIDEPNITIRLVGKNVFTSGDHEGVASIRAKAGSTTIEGSGSLVAKTVCRNKLVLKSGALKGNVRSEGDFLVKGGSVGVGGKSNNGYCQIDVCGNFVMKAGVIRIPIQAAFNKKGRNMFKISGGTLAIKQTCFEDSAVFLDGRNLVMSGGALKLADADVPGLAIIAEAKKAKGKKYGGTVKVTGGSITALGDIEAVKMTNKPSHLKKVRGRLPNGASFKAGKNEFQIRHAGHYTNLTKYGGKKTTVRLCKEIKFGGETYRVDGVGSKAFDTKAGHKVKRITTYTINGSGFLQQIEYLAPKAFYNTKSLRRLELSLLTNHTAKDGKLLSMRIDNANAKSEGSSISVSKSAFKRCGKNGGSALTVVFGMERGVSPEDVDVYRAFFVKYGMSSKVNILAEDYGDNYWL